MMMMMETVDRVWVFMRPLFLSGRFVSRFCLCLNLFWSAQRSRIQDLIRPTRIIYDICGGPRTYKGECVCVIWILMFRGHDILQNIRRPLRKFFRHYNKYVLTVFSGYGPLRAVTYLASAGCSARPTCAATAWRRRSSGAPIVPQLRASNPP